MADSQRIDIPGVGVVEFPDTMSAEDVNAAAKRLHDEANRPSDSGALTMAGARAAVPAVGNLALRVATSPTVPRTTGAIARSLTTGLGLAAGGYQLAKGNLQGGVSQVAAAPLEGWAAGRGGYWLGKGVQALARPVASAADALAPVTQALAPLNIAQGALDLAQMADPGRKDLGFLGMATGDPGDPEHPAALNALVDLIRRKLTGRFHFIHNLLLLIIDHLSGLVISLYFFLCVFHK